ncbi:MAG: hypothetical protein HY744_13415 [Deltaproteobacteria bacterium]|nr:hypothetical protein [Deltaproteobacteria bacterium]
MQTDPAHCGGCGKACAQGEVCSAGACALQCFGGTTKCGNKCVDLATDLANCGGCGSPCGGGQICLAGKCSLECVGGTTKCGQKCVDTATDPAHCGGCGKPCAPGQVCSSGLCSLDCVGGTTKCGQECVDTTADPANCGKCGAACPPGQVCSSALCSLECVGGTTKCGSSCVNTSSDPLHCGKCGAFCTGGQICAGGACSLECVGGSTKCGSSCVDLQTSPAHCGKCDSPCGGGQICEKGVCKGLVCAPNAVELCYTGPKDTLAVGECKPGTKTCKPDGTGYLACSGEVLPAQKEICANNKDDDCNGKVDDGCTLKSCKEILAGNPNAASGKYTIDPDGQGGEDPIDAYCEMALNSGGWTLCASLTKGYVPSDTIYNFKTYAFQARKNNSRNFVYDQDAPARTTNSWDNSEQLNYGQFCRLLGNGVNETWIMAKMYNWANNAGASAKNTNYNLVKSGIYQGNLFLQWFTNSASARTFTRLSGDQLYVTNNNNGYGGPYTTPNVGWVPNNETAPYTHSSNPWGAGGQIQNANCVGCTESGGPYSNIPYGQTTILNNMGHPFWTGVANVRYGWSDCTANGNCNYHESGFGVWLFFVR